MAAPRSRSVVVDRTRTSADLIDIANYGYAGATGTSLPRRVAHRLLNTCRTESSLDVQMYLDDNTGVHEVGLTSSRALHDRAKVHRLEHGCSGLASSGSSSRFPSAPSPADTSSTGVTAAAVEIVRRLYP